MELTGPSGRTRILVALLVGLATMGYGAYSYSAQSSALNSAVEVNATVVSTAVEKRTTRGVSYRPRATFDYSYEGETYTSSNLYPGKLPREFDTRAAARAELEAYEPGEPVTAYVPPDEPGNAFLRQESSEKPFLVIGFGALFVVGAIRSALTN